MKGPQAGESDEISSSRASVECASIVLGQSIGDPSHAFCLVSAPFLALMRLARLRTLATALASPDAALLEQDSAPFRHARSPFAASGAILARRHSGPGFRV